VPRSRIWNLGSIAPDSSSKKFRISCLQKTLCRKTQIEGRVHDLAVAEITKSIPDVAPL